MLERNSIKTNRIELEPVGRRTDLQEGRSLLEAIQDAGIELVAVCGGMGICEGCRIRVVEGKVSPPTLEEEADLSDKELAQGFRLACQTIPLGDVKVDIPPESLTTPQRLQVEGQARLQAFDPVVRAIAAQVDIPNLHDLRSDETRIKDALQDCGLQAPGIGLEVLKDLSSLIRSQNWEARFAVHDGEVVGILPGTGSIMLGLAVDVGTTKIAAYLINLETGETLSSSGAMNPQIAYGEDVISRILYADQHEDGREVLQRRLVDTLNQLVEELCMAIGAQSSQIVDAVVVGNTAMHHLFAGLPVKQLGASPYVPAVSAAMQIRASSIGLRLAPGAYVYLPPNIAGYVGADHISMLLASGIDQPSPDRTIIALDIGTNTEISLAKDGRILSCSTASGPAFEGAHIHDGMRAAPGAIEKIKLQNDKFMIHTISDRLPVGICGSGILDMVAQLVEHGVTDRTGNLLANHPLVQIQDHRRQVLLMPAERTGHGRDIVVTRKDINEIQLAKGAIRTGMEIMLQETGGRGVDEVIVAGAFGTYLDIESAVRIGMFPNLPAERFRQVGNAAGAGARQMLLSRQRRQDASHLAERIEYIELTTHPKFTETFVKAIMF
jgi:uncharacterized 2Fe-2S/4Fe-4S cluster protein (DUF4445 family)